MAQNQFINVTVDPASAKKVDNADHKHTVAPSTAAAGDLTISWDSAKITSASLLRSAVLAAIQNAAGQLPK